MLLLPEETIIYGSPEAGFAVTSHRLRMDSKSRGQAQVTSMMLEELCSAELRYSSQPLLFVLAFLVLILGGLGTFLASAIHGSGIMNVLKIVPLCGSVLFAMGLVFIYFITRRMTLVFASVGASIVLDAMSLGLQTSKELIDTIEAAKDYRFMQSDAFRTRFQPVWNTEEGWIPSTEST
jgi:hypothetical protein